jgi:hypothetical protein
LFFEKMDNLAVPALSAGYAYAGSRFLLGNTGNVSIGSTSVDKNLAIAGLVGAGALVSTLSKDYIIPRIPGDARVKQIAQSAVGPVVCGAATYGLEKALVSSSNTLLGTPNTSSSMANAALGVGSYVAASYTYSAIAK